MGAIAINFYPDVSFTAHGPYIPRSLPHYNWIFTTTTFGLADMDQLLGIRNASFLPHAFDPETHTPHEICSSDKSRYGAEISFIGTWSPKKERLLSHVHDALPGAKLRIWGAQWEKSTSALTSGIEHESVTGTEYAKAICASAINLAILSEARKDSSSGDLTTARTFEIPASGGFMLHERTEEAMQFFEEDKECAFFSDADELVAKIDYYLARPDERRRIAAAGRRRCLESGYSVDARVETVLAKYHELRAARMGTQVAAE
jgi:spore maturation protein CgeB